MLTEFLVLTVDNKIGINTRATTLQKFHQVNAVDFQAKQPV